jgi:NAD(P)-dependent dehydrogenase (short-subunit alcohol dehydrogenase family)|tara:strand:- start:3382 stop:4146 length:765 start_codon:yes stop_codon:yes gene_type:complete
MSLIQKLFSLEGKVSIVTGASGGLGSPIAVALAKAGSKVYLLDQNRQADSTAVHLRSIGSQAEFYHIDLTNKEEIDRFISFICKEEEKVDVLINAAGITYPQEFSNYEYEKWDMTYKINLLAPYLMSKGLGLKMENGSIINFTSINAELAFPNNPAYVTFKHGLKGLTKALALELGKNNTRVNNIGPGYMMTSMTEGSWSNPEVFEARKKKTFLDRWGNPDDLIGAIIFLASDCSSYVTGQDLYIDGGWTAKGL